MASVGSPHVQIHQLPKLESLEAANQLEYVFDYGGSLTKLLFKADPKKLDNYKLDIQHSGRLFVALFPHDDRQSLFSFIEDAGLAGESDKLVHTTGIGAKLYRQEMETRLGPQFEVHDEMDCYIKGLCYLLKQLTFDELFWPLEKTGFEVATRITDTFLGMSKKLTQESLVENSWSSETGKFSLTDPVAGNVSERYDGYYDNTASQFPCLILVCGSGNLIVKMESETSRAELVEYTARSGRTILGLGSLLTGSKSFDELLDLATRGNSRNVDTHLKDIKGGDPGHVYGMFPDDGLSFCFGKANNKSIGDFSREDLAAAVFSMVLDDLAQTGLALAIANHMPNVIYCGSLLNHEVARGFLTKHFLAKSMTMAKEVQPSLKMCRLGSHLGAIGTWLYAMDT